MGIKKGNGREGYDRMGRKELVGRDTVECEG